MIDGGPWSAEQRKAMALDPTTPTELLCQLALEFPVEVTDNPVFPFLLIENPTLMDEWRTREGSDASLALLAQGRLPEEILRAFVRDASDYDRQQLAAANPFLPPDLFPILVRERSNIHLSRGLAANPSLPGPLLRVMAARKVDYVRAAAAGNPSLPFEELVQLSFDEGLGVRMATLYQDRLPAPRVRALMADLDRDVRQAALGHPQHDPDFARLLREAGQGCGPNREPMLRLPTETLEALAREGPHARRLAASHPEAPPALLEKLAGDECPAVVEAAAANPTTPPAALALLPRTPRIQEALLTNPATPSALLGVVAADLLLAVGESPSAVRQLQHRIVSHPQVTAALLDQLRAPHDLKLHEWIAAHPEATASTLVRLSSSRNPRARAAVARHPACPAAVRATLAADPEEQVRQAAVEAEQPAPGSRGDGAQGLSQRSSRLS